MPHKLPSPNNPLLDRYLQYTGGERITDWLSTNRNWTQGMELRSSLVHEYAWAIPTPEAIFALVALSPIIEIGAGRGYWAKLIEDEGGEILPFDIRPPKNGRNHWHKGGTTFTKVHYGSAATVCKYPNHTLFLCWPPYEKLMAYEALSNHSGKFVVYIGEGHGGCTADDQFHEMLEDGFNQIGHIEIPQWPCIHDSMWIYERK